MDGGRDRKNSGSDGDGARGRLQQVQHVRDELGRRPVAVELEREEHADYDEQRQVADAFVMNREDKEAS